MISEFVRKILHIVMEVPRKLYRKKRAKKLNNSDFTIISSDCFGTFAYHDLNQRFNSPTINLFFSQNDFLQFVSHLREYLNAELIEIKEHSKSYPVGALTYNNQTIRVEFMHYSSFEKAKAKWNERKQRVDYSNLYIVQTVPKNLTQEYADAFSALPYKHKLLITHRNDLKCECMVDHDIFGKENYQAGEFLSYKSNFSYKRYMDDIDYIGFVNSK